MARTALAVQQVRRAGLEPAYTAANADGHAIANTGKEVLHVKNGGGGSINVTAVIPGTVDGQAIGDRVVAVPAGEERIIGPFPGTIYDQPGTTDMHVDFSGVTSVTVAALRAT